MIRRVALVFSAIATVGFALDMSAAADQLPVGGKQTAADGAPVSASGGSVRLSDPDVFPESITTSQSGDVIIGSVAQHYIYRARPRDTIARRWIDLSAHNSASYGVLADDRSRTLWTCTLVIGQTGRRPPPPAERSSTLRSFDLRTGQPKGAWPLPGSSNSCNDVVIAPDGSAFVSDIINGQILRLKRGAASFDRRYAGPETSRVDGLAFIGRTLYFTNLDTGGVYRLPDSMADRPGVPIPLRLSTPLKGPDALRSHKGRLYIADNQLHEVVELTLRGDTASVRVIAAGLDGPTGVSPGDRRIWIAEIRSRLWTDPVGQAGSIPFVVQWVRQDR